MSAAARHRRIAAVFSAAVERTLDWQAPTPVPGWAASDVVGHLVDWSTAFLAAGGVTLPGGEYADPRAAWRGHTGQVQALLDSPGAAAPFTHPYLGTAPLGETLDRVYTTDVLMHTWDLAEAAGVPSGLDPAECAELLEGMRSIEELLRSSGQYGPAVPVGDDADPVVALMGFVGRDPAWRVSAG